MEGRRAGGHAGSRGAGRRAGRPPEASNAGPLPPDQQINITVEDAKAAGPAAGPTCWQVFYHIHRHPPQQNIPFELVGDNGKVCGGSSTLMDKDPSVGHVRITISRLACGATYGDSWHVLQTARRR